MNLAYDPWIPVIVNDGGHELFSLLDVFLRGQEVPDLDVRPHERIALIRLFLCIAHAALDGPKDEEEWAEAPKKLPLAVQEYLERWKDAFELFHPERPFLQAPVSAAGDTPVSKLDFALASGNNATLFDHAALNPEGRIFPPARLALMLLTHVCFALGGGVSGNVWRGAAHKQNFTDAPCCSGSMAHTLLRGENLLQSVCLNICSYDSLALHYEYALGADWLGRPLWEIPPLRFSDERARRNAETTYLGRLIPLSRALRLNADCTTMFYEMGLKLPVFPEFPAEISGATVYSDKKGTTCYIGLRPQRGIWRDLAALTVRRKSSEGAVTGPLCFNMFIGGEDCDIVVGGLAREPGKATALHCPESVYHIPAGMLADRGRGVYADAVALAESTGELLRWAVKEYKRTCGAETGFGSLGVRAEAHYWAALEKRLDLAFLQVRCLDAATEFFNAKKKWQDLLRKSALDAYDLACPKDGVRALRAFVLGRRKLFGKISGNPT